MEVPNFSPMDVVTRSFRRLVMIHHPDRAGGNQESMKSINSAYDDLKRYKSLYDSKLREYLQPEIMQAFTIIMAAGWSFESAYATTASNY